MLSSDRAIEVTGLRYQLPGTEIDLFGGLDFEIAKGETVVLVTNSSNVASSLIQLLAGLTAPDAGEIRIAGRSIAAMKGRDSRTFYREVGVVSSAIPLLDDRDVWSNIVLPLELDGSLDGKSRHRTNRLLLDLGIAATAHRNTADLTVSERAKVLLARSLVREPLLLIADDPTLGLNETHAQEITDILNQQSVRGMTIVLATPDRRLADALNGARTIAMVGADQLHAATAL